MNKKVEIFYITFVISELTRDEINKNWKAKEDLARFQGKIKEAHTPCITR